MYVLYELLYYVFKECEQERKKAACTFQYKHNLLSNNFDLLSLESRGFGTHSCREVAYTFKNIYVFECLPTCMLVHQMCAWYSWRPEEDVRSLGTGVMDD